MCFGHEESERGFQISFSGPDTPPPQQPRVFCVINSAELVLQSVVTVVSALCAAGLDNYLNHDLN